MGEPREPGPVQVQLQRRVTRAEHVQPEVELLAAQQQGVHDIRLHYVVLDPLSLDLPGRHLAQLVDQEDALALALRHGLHYPDPLVLGAFEFLDEQAVL